jgi:hypothetical protein
VQCAPSRAAMRACAWQLDRERQAGSLGHEAGVRVHTRSGRGGLKKLVSSVAWGETSAPMRLARAHATYPPPNNAVLITPPPSCSRVADHARQLLAEGRGARARHDAVQAPEGTTDRGIGLLPECLDSTTSPARQL